MFENCSLRCRTSAYFAPARISSVTRGTLSTRLSVARTISSRTAGSMPDPVTGRSFPATRRSPGSRSAIRLSTRSWMSITSTAPYAREIADSTSESKNVQRISFQSSSAPVKTTSWAGMNRRRTFATVRLRNVTRMSWLIASTRITRSPPGSRFRSQNSLAVVQNCGNSAESVRLF